MDKSLINQKDRLVFSFTLTYILLLTTGTVTFIEALRTNIPLVRHIFNLETVISLVAGYFYGKFVEKIKYSYDNNKSIDWDEVIKTRYLDWSITTPIMLIVLVNVLAHHLNIYPSFRVFLVIFVLNYLMLYIGYRGEFQKNKMLYMILGFIPFILMYYIIYCLYVRPKYNQFNYIIFFFFLIIWSIYGLIYNMDVRTKNIVYNYLDLVAKCFVGLGLWLYFSNLFKA